MFVKKNYFEKKKIFIYDILVDRLFIYNIMCMSRNTFRVPACKRAADRARTGLVISRRNMINLTPMVSGVSLGLNAGVTFKLINRAPGIIITLHLAILCARGVTWGT